MTQQAAPAALFAGLLKGKKGLILGVANNRSIAWGIAKACADAGADLALTYQIEALEKRVRPLAADIGATVVGRCDVSEPETMDAVFAEIEKLWGRLDFVVHCLAYSDKDQLDGRYVETTLENFQMSLQHLLLLLHRASAARREADDGRRLAVDARPITAPRNGCRITM